ncbi:MAG: GNAT family N-acetyltransferase [Deltaproteobacteria bacterium]|nr:GNAT family N-acetyltransferase [Deltaproteobacteria bacterium]
MSPPDVGPRLQTPRLLLRPPGPADLPATCAMNADPEVMRFFPAPMRPDEVELMLGRIDAHFARCGFGFWAVERRDNAAVIGLIGLVEVTFALPGRPCPPPAGARPPVEVGWRLVSSAWGQGFAREGATAALRFAFEGIALPEVLSFTVPANTRSWGLMERLGLRRDPAGGFEHPRLPVGHPLRPHLLYGIDRAGWSSAQGSAR